MGRLGAVCAALIALQGCIPAGRVVRPWLFNGTNEPLLVSFRSNSSREQESLDVTLASGGTMSVPRTRFVPAGKPPPSAEIHVLSPSADERRVIRVEFVRDGRYEIVASGDGYEVRPPSNGTGDSVK